MPATTARELMDMGLRPATPSERLRAEILGAMEAMRARGLSEEEALQALYPTTVLPLEVLQTLTSALVAGTHGLLFGPPGSGKTSLAKDVWGLFPKRAWVVADCPVQDDPFSLVHEAYSRMVPPCPFCKMRYGGIQGSELREFRASEVDPSRVPVREGVLREGHGLARVQGSSEVFPDHLTGSVNLHRLEEIGDPMSPLVLEPGKLLQANRGLLIVDEIGKLPVGAQNVLLQALQESTVSPAKSRETFPAAFVAVCTSNLGDLDNITEPLSDRLANVYVGFNRSHSKNRLIVNLALEARPPSVLFPDALLEAGVYLIEEWRRSAGEIYELSEVGSNRTMIDIALRSEAYASLEASAPNESSGGGAAGEGDAGPARVRRMPRVVTIEHFKRGTLDAMMGHVRARGGDSYAQDERTVQEFLKKQFGEALHRAGLEYWCTFFSEVLKRDVSEAKRVLEECRRALVSPQDDLRRAPKLARFAGYATQRERFRGRASDLEVALAAFAVVNELGVFECEGKK
ncbi:MAG: ATP-binding protein [Thermoplasmatota archaeon]